MLAYMNLECADESVQYVYVRIHLYVYYTLRWYVVYVFIHVYFGMSSLSLSFSVCRSGVFFAFRTSGRTGARRPQHPHQRSGMH